MTPTMARRLILAFFIQISLASYGVTALGSGAWEQANQLYQKGEYDRAADAYRSLLEENPSNPFLHYNLANAYFKQGTGTTLGSAVAEYWRAYKLLPRDSDIRYNLDFALKRAGDTLVPAGIPGFLHYLFHILSESELAGVFWIGWWVFLLLGSLYMLTKANLRSNLRLYIVASLLICVMSGSWWGLRRLGDIPNMGVILDANAEARSGPGSNFSVSFNAPEGRRISIISRQGDWIEIDMLKEGLRGWVPSKSVEQVDKA